MDKKELKIILEEIGLPKAEISVYSALLDGVISVKEIMKITNEKRPTVYYSLASLEKRGLVSKTGKDYGNKFQLEPLDKLLELININIRKQNQLLDRAEKIKKYYPLKKRENATIVSNFDNLISIKPAIFFTLYGKEKIIRSMVPGNNFFHELGEDFINEYVGEKLKRGLKTKALWEDIPNKEVLKKYYSESDLRQLPVSMHNSFETTVFIYDDKTLYIAPKKENSAVLIQSKQHAKMMRAVFDEIWNLSTDIKA